MIRFACPSCGKSIKVRNEGAGRKGKCPGCGVIIQVPDAASVTAKSQAAVSDRWFLKTEDGEDYGPVEKAELDQWLKEGLVTLKCHIWQEGVSQWRPAKEIYPELEEEKPASTPATVPHAVGTKREIIEAPAHSQPVYRQLQPSVTRPAAIQVNPAQSRAALGLGIASLVLGIISFFVCWLPYVGFGFGTLAFVLGVISLMLAISRQESGIGFSIAGTAVSSVAVIMGLVLTVIVASTFSAVDEGVSELDSVEATTVGQSATEEPSPELSGITISSLLFVFGLPALFASRTFIPAFISALFLRYGEHFPFLQGLEFLQATGSEPVWFTHDLTIIALGLLAALEVAALKNQDVEVLLFQIEKHLKTGSAALSSLGVLSASDAAFVEQTIQRAGFGSAILVVLVGAATWFLAALRASIWELLIDADEDDDLGIRRLLSWCGDLGAVLGVFFLLLYPVAMLLMMCMVFGALELLRRYSAWREEKSKVPCANCGEENYPCAIACHKCNTRLPKPCDVGFLGQAKNVPTPNMAEHPYRLVEKKRCPVCATRLKGRSPRQECPACGHQLFARAAFVEHYAATVAKRLPTVLGVSALLSLIPVIGLIPGVIYYRISLVAPFRRYMGFGNRFVLKWGLRLIFFVLIGFQVIPMAGALVVPVMALLGYWAYRSAFMTAVRSPEPIRREIGATATAIH